jgi:hypothetical protein
MPRALVFDYGDWLSSDIARLLSRNGYRVHSHVDIHRWTIFRLFRVLLFSARAKRPLHDRRRVLEFLLIDCFFAVSILALRPNLIVCSKSQAILSLIAARLLGIHAVCVFGSVPIQVDEWVTVKAKCIWTSIESMQCALSTTIVCESSHVAQTLPATKVVIVHSFMPSVLPAQFSGAPATFDQPEGNCPAPPPRVLFVASSPRKGTALVLAAAPRLKPPLCQLNVITDDPTWMQHRHISIHPTLPRSEFLQALARSDVILLPTHCDGGPRLLFEAILLGKHAICSRYCAGPDLEGNALITIIDLDTTSLEAALTNVVISAERSRAGVALFQHQLKQQHERLLERVRHFQNNTL